MVENLDELAISASGVSGHMELVIMALGNGGSETDDFYFQSYRYPETSTQLLIWQRMRNNYKKYILDKHS